VLVEKYKGFFTGESQLPKNNRFDSTLKIKKTVSEVKPCPKRRHSSVETIEFFQIFDTGLKNSTIMNPTLEISSLIRLVKKVKGTLRMCIDYRQLNKYVERDIYALLHINQLMENLSCLT
jgi:hypothetical protein